MTGIKFVNSNSSNNNNNNIIIIIIIKLIVNKWQVRRTERAMVRPMCGAKLMEKKRTEDLM